MNDNGYLPLSRSVFKHDLWIEKREFSKFEAWVDLLQMASFDQEEKTKLVGLNILKWGRGQLPASVRFLQDRWQWKSTKRVFNFLQLLINEKMIIVKKETGQNIITICKYDNYNSISKTGKRQGNAKETAGKREGNETNKENKENKEKNDYIIPEGFDDRWNKFQTWVKDQDFKYVPKIEEQLTATQLKNLIDKVNATVIKDKLLALENGGTKYIKNKSVYLTINNWINRDLQNG